MTRDERLERVVGARRWVASAVRRYGGGPDTSDIVQEVMVAACASIDGFRGEGSLRTWLWRIAANQTFKRMHEARSRRQRETTVRWEPSASCPMAHFESAERLRAFEVAFAAMPPELQDAFVDRLDGRTFAAMAERHGVSIGTAHRRAMLARAHLESALGGP